MRVLAQAPEFAQKHSKAALVTLVATAGSTPRHPGTHMLVSGSGAQLGTIGGGRVEYEVVKAAQAVANGGPVVTTTHNLVRDLAMCCGGSMTFFTQPLAPCLPAIGELIQRHTERLPSWTVIDLSSKGMTVFRDRPSTQEGGTDTFSQSIVPSPRVILFGCGHLSRALGPLAADLGFEVVLCDDNQTSAIDDLPDWADALVPSFELRDIESKVGQLGEQDYVLVLTRDHGIDQRIVEACLPHVDRLAYLGLIGSLGKIGRFRKRILAKKIVTTEQWDKLHGPIGLDIGAETPSEIAVSILAELVKIKNIPGRVGA